MSKASIVKDITFGICGSLVDLFIWQIALVGASVGKSGPRGVHQAFNEADEFLSKVNHRTLAVTWYQLTKRRLITYKKRRNIYNPQITEFGEKRLKEVLPEYQKVRPWDKKIYLITYDIPEKSHKKRDLLRGFLFQIGARFLQESTWITPYNPRELLNEFSFNHQIQGTIIASDLGTDGGIGETSIQDLLVRLYSLEKINDKYEEFLQSVKKGIPIQTLLFQYLSILNDDPQLPFELLPKGWLGDKAQIIYQKLKEKYILSYRGRTIDNI